MAGHVTDWRLPVMSRRSAGWTPPNLDQLSPESGAPLGQGPRQVPARRYTYVEAVVGRIVPLTELSLYCLQSKVPPQTAAARRKCPPDFARNMLHFKLKCPNVLRILT